MPVQRLPGDEHGHDHGLARFGRHLERDPGQPGVVRGVLRIDLLAPVAVTVPARDLREEDRGLRGFPLAEQHSIFAFGAGPVLQEFPARRRRAVVAALAPQVDIATKLVDHRVAFPAFTGDVEVDGFLGFPSGSPSSFPRRRDRDERLAGSASDFHLAGRPVRTHLEMLGRRVVRTVQDRIDGGLRQAAPCYRA